MMTPEEAIQIVAQDAIVYRLSGYPPEWEDYPEIGMQDWDAVVDAAQCFIPRPSRDKLKEAMEILKGRASE